MNLDQLLDRASRQSEMAEVFLVTRTGTPVEYENNRLKTISTAEHAGVALRLVVEGRVGFATTTKMDGLDEVLDFALASARYGGPAEFDLPGAEELATGKALTYDPAVTELTVEEMARLGESLLDPVRKHDPAIQAFAGVDREESTLRLANSNGFAGEYSSTGFSLWTGGELVEGENMIWVYEAQGRGNLGNPAADVEKLTARVVNHLTLARRNVPFRNGTYPVIFSPRALTDLLRPLVASLDGKAVEKGFSPWRNRIGQQVAGPDLTLVDDGTIPYGPRSGPFDGEGTPTQRTPLLTNGVLENYYLDRRTARKLGLKPTGNGLRGLGSLPSPSPTNLILRGGDRPYREILAGIREGVLVENLLGAWAGNPYAGEVSGNISLGYLVRDGEPVGRIKNCLFACNAFTVFGKQLVALSQEQEWVGAELLPYALFEGISISTQS